MLLTFENCWGFCYLLNMSIIPLMLSGAGEITTEWFQGPIGPTVRWIWTKTSLITWPPWPLTGGPQWHFVYPWISVSSEAVSSNLQKTWLFPFPSAQSTLGHGVILVTEWWFLLLVNLDSALAIARLALVSGSPCYFQGLQTPNLWGN